MIPSARPTVPPVAITIFRRCFFCFAIFRKVGTDGSMCENNDHCRPRMWVSRVDQFQFSIILIVLKMVLQAVHISWTLIKCKLFIIVWSLFQRDQQALKIFCMLNMRERVYKTYYWTAIWTNHSCSYPCVFDLNRIGKSKYICHGKAQIKSRILTAQSECETVKLSEVIID